MYTVKEDTTLIGVSELRAKIERILEEAKHRKIIIEKRNKPIAVLVAIDRYNAMEGIIDLIENMELGRLAKEREKGSSAKDYISIEKALKKIN